MEKEEQTPDQKIKEASIIAVPVKKAMCQGGHGWYDENLDLRMYYEKGAVSEAARDYWQAQQPKVDLKVLENEWYGLLATQQIALKPSFSEMIFEHFKPNLQPESKAFLSLRSKMIDFLDKKGDEKALLTKGGKSFTGKELSNEIQLMTEQGNEFVNSMVMLAVDLFSRQKVTYPLDDRIKKEHELTQSIYNQFKKDLIEKDEQLQEMYDMLKEAKVQIEYLHGKFSKTGTGESVISQIQTILEKYEKGNK